VQVAWTRAEEFFYDGFDPAAVVRITSGVDRNGRLTLWDYQVFAAGSRGSEVFYDVPNRRVRVHGSWGGGEDAPSDYHPFAVGPWRAPGANTNCFAGESQIDAMAAAAGIDPLQFRLENTRDERMLGVLRAVADAAGWTPGVAPRRSGGGRGRGLACGVDAGAYVAHVAEVTVDEATGQVRVDRVVCAQDMGVVVNPDGARMQAEGGVMMGLGYTLAEALRFRGGDVLDRNFDSYRLPRFSWLPRIETVLVRNDEVPPQGGGEPAIICMGAVVANAVFDATGARIRQLPLTPERVLAGMKQV